MKVAKIFKILAVTLTFQLLFGCQSQAQGSIELYQSQEEKIKSALICNLSSKYDNDNFEILSLEEDNSGHGVPFETSSYIAEVFSSKYGNSFYTLIKSDKSDFRDSYPSLIWDDDLQKLVDNAIQNTDNIDIIDYKTIYRPYDTNAKDLNDMYSYLKNQESFVNIELSIQTTLSTVEAAQAIHSLVKNLDYAGLPYYTLECYYFNNNNTLIFSKNSSGSKTDYDSILKDLEIDFERSKNQA